MKSRKDLIPNASADLQLLPDEDRRKLQALLKIYMAIYDFSGDQMLAHLQHNYGLDPEKFYPELDPEGVGRFLRDFATDGSGLSRRKVDLAKWQEIISDLERKCAGDVKTSIYGAGKHGKSFYEQNKINWDSVYNLSNNISKSNSIIYLNTYIGYEEWFDPNVQMHLCIQKSIEQKMNYYNVHNCHKNFKSKDPQKNKHIDKCYEYPPVYRQYRILFYPKDRKQLDNIIDTKDSEYHKLTYAAYMHASLSIQLAIFTLDDWYTLIRENIPFFTNRDNLADLDLNEEIITCIKNGLSKEELHDLVLKSLEKQKNTPRQANNEGIDFMLANITPIEEYAESSGAGIELKGDIYSTFYEEKRGDTAGLNYFLINDNRQAITKNNFINLVFNKIIKLGIANDDLAYKVLDPIHSFYSSKGAKLFRQFTTHHDASQILHLR